MVPESDVLEVAEKVEEGETKMLVYASEEMLNVSGLDVELPDALKVRFGLLTCISASNTTPIRTLSTPTMLPSRLKSLKPRKQVLWSLQGFQS
jgi:hypothetical protein